MDPLVKRQRRAPAWTEAFVDPEKLTARATHSAPRTSPSAERTSSPPGSSSPSQGEANADGAEILESRLLDNNHVEVVVRYKGRRFCGVMERSALPQGVGVPSAVTHDELAAIAASHPHGENPTNMCALCNTALEVPPVQGLSDDKAGLYLKVRITSNWTARVHAQCADWCPEAAEDPALPNYYLHIGNAVRRGRALRCTACGQRGATVGCFAEGCPHVYHLACAAGAGCTLEDETHEVWCPSHRP